MRVILFALTVCACSGQPEPARMCLDEVVVELVSSNYRTVTVRTSAGSLVELYSPTVKPGDKISVCK